jgi:fluoride exporter
MRGMRVLNLFLVFAGGGIGALARYGLAGVVYRRIGSSFPYDTLLVNILGCLLIGLLMTAFEDRFLVTPSLRIFLTIGILGGFTTFSTFSYETIALLRDGEILFASLNVLGSMLLCLFGTYIGTTLGKLL